MLAIADLRDFERESLVTLGPDALVMDAQKLLRERGVHHLPVLDGESLVGLVCTCDMLVVPPDVTLRDIMKIPVTLQLTDTAETAAQLMHDREVGSIVLLDGTRAAGIVTRGELMTRRPAASDHAGLKGCACCGVREHLRTAEDGRVLCIFCYSVDRADFC